ncbi:DNA repair protein RecO [Ancylomarina salipaludis]|uniref:DNA repair protein RecO n=1 Tax=Ancylomarina salipaludis TaxID=2501299 RepID=A0A4Q1JHU5_9BACT|nr:DNA repair protein RecO [Ancylomarina salipaludis]RXQ87616.1 DNA repair protein RecO [Ancylomarina salipaludis]
MLHKTRAVILACVKYGDTSLIVHAYTEKFGRQSYMIKGGRSKKSRTKLNLFQPLFLLDMNVSHRDGKNLQMIKEAQFSEITPHLNFEAHKNPLVLFLAEVLSKVLKEEEGDTQLFGFLADHITYLIQVEDIPRAYHLNFLMNLTRFLGFYPHDNWSDAKPFFDLDNAVFVSLENRHAHCLSQAVSYLFHQLLQTQLSLIDQMDISSDDLKLLLRGILNIYALHSPGFTKLKSFAIFEDLNDY